jgi:hypothetical protein
MNFIFNKRNKRRSHPQPQQGRSAGDSSPPHERQGKNMFSNIDNATRVQLHMVQFTHEGMLRLGQFIQDAARRLGLPLTRIKESMADTMYVVPPGGRLVFLFSVPELEADVHVELPKKFWRYADAAPVSPDAPDATDATEPPDADTAAAAKNERAARGFAA